MLYGNDNGPLTSMEEDLEFLGVMSPSSNTAVGATRRALAEQEEQTRQAQVQEQDKKAEKGKDAEDEDEDEDEDESKGEADGRTEVEPRNEDKLGIDEDDAVELIAHYAEHHDLSADDVDRFLEDDAFLGDVLMFALIEAKKDDDNDKDEEPDDDEDDEDDDVEESEVVGAAFQVIDAFYDRIGSLREGDDQPSYDDLVAVIEAVEHVAEDMAGVAGLEESSKRMMGLRALRKARKKAKRLAKRGKVKKATLKLAKRGKRMIAGKEVKVGRQEVQALRGMLGHSSARMRKNIRKRIKSAKLHKAVDWKARAKGKVMAADVENNGSPLSELVQNLADLRNAVEESQEFETAAEELAEGFGSVSTVATRYYERIAKEIQESKDVAEDDDRVAMGRYLESIAQDAAKRATAIAEGDNRWSLDQYAQDLEALAHDLDDAMEAMKGIE